MTAATDMQRVVQRMDFVTGNGGAMVHDPDGDYIRYSAHQSLLAEAERRAQYWKDEHLAGNAKIDALQAEVDAVRGLADELMVRATQYREKSATCLGDSSYMYNETHAEASAYISHEIRAALGES